MITENGDKIVLFGPRSNKALQRQYPELSKEPEFKDLAGDEMHFAWLMGNPSSPVDPEWTPQVRMTNAAAVAFISNPEKKKLYSSGAYSDAVKIAIERMSRYAPEARLVAKRIVQTIFQNYQKMVDVDVDKDFLTTKKVGKGEDAEEITEMDWTGRKQYIDSVKTIAETLPNLIKQLEEGFGIELKKGEEVGTKSIDVFHKNRTQQQ